MKVAYPVFIKQNKKSFLAYVPDMDAYTEGKDFCDAIEMARDLIGTKGIDLEDDSKSFPKASDAYAALAKAKKEADADFDFSDGTLTFVDVDTVAYRNKLRNLSVKKNCTIPSWLNDKAERQGVNFSRVLQDALIEIVGAN